MDAVPGRGSAVDRPGPLAAETSASDHLFRKRNLTPIPPRLGHQLLLPTSLQVQFTPKIRIVSLNHFCLRWFMLNIMYPPVAAGPISGVE